MTTMEFLAFLLTDHRPSLCSCPIPAIRVLPSSANSRLLTKPLTGIRARSTSAFLAVTRAHMRTNPSFEPDAIRSVFLSVATEQIQPACAFFTVVSGFFLLMCHTARWPSFVPDTKCSSFSMHAQSIESLKRCV